MRRLALAGLLLLLAHPSWATQPSVTSTYNGAGTSGTTATISSVACPGSNTLLLVFAGSNAEGVPTSGTKGATSLTELVSTNYGGIAHGSIWYLKGASNTSETVTMTWGSSPSAGAAASAVCLQDVDQTTTFGGQNSQATTNTAISGANVTGSASNDLIIDTVSIQTGGGITISPDAGTTQQTTINPLGGWTLVSGTHASGTSLSPNWTASSSTNFTQIVVNLLGTGGGGPATHFFNRRIQP